MKKIIILLFLFIALPCSVKANIICNDGTRSPSCKDCHQGCCSHHGGCTANPNRGSNNYSSKKNTTTQAPRTTKRTTTSTKRTTVSTTTTTTTSTRTTSNKNIIDSELNYDVEASSDDSSVLAPLAVIGGVGVSGYFLTKKRGK